MLIRTVTEGHVTASKTLASNIWEKAKVNEFTHIDTHSILIRLTLLLVLAIFK
jgi:hypothetical protein